MKICNLCPLLDAKGDKCGVPGTQPCCSECGCSLALKLRSLESSCPYPGGPKWEAATNESNQHSNQNSNHGGNFQTGESQLRKPGS